MENITFTAREFPKPVLTVIKKIKLNCAWGLSNGQCNVYVKSEDF